MSKTGSQLVADVAANGEMVRQQVRRMLASPEFKATDSQKAFLKFVVEKALTGKSDEIKGYTVAVQVFGRREDFDQSTDPVVSIHANKLRRALERYYLVVGQQDPIRIDIPKGTYVPSFFEPSLSESTEISGRNEVQENLPAWPMLAVRPFQNLTGDAELDYLAIGLATELAVEITRYQEIRVLLYRHEGPARRASDRAHFVLDGSVRKDISGIKVTVHLVDLSNGVQVWGDTHKTDHETARDIAFQEQVAREVAANIAGESGIIAKTLSVGSKNIPPSDLKTYEAFLRYYEFNFTYSKMTFQSAYDALKSAASKDPHCGLVWSLLSRLYAGNFSLELCDVETPIEEAVDFARKGVRLDPTNRRVIGALAYALLIGNDLAEGLTQAERGIALNPDSLLLMDGFGYLLTLMGDWERGPELIRRAIKHNPYYNLIVHYALWVDQVRRREYEQAYLESLHFVTPQLFWDPLMKTASLALLGRMKEARQSARELLKLKPDFPRRGRILIEHYIKFEEIVKRIISALQSAGIDIH